jgi:transposase-like protein
MARGDNFRKWNDEMDAVLTRMCESAENSAEEIASKLGVTVQTVYPRMRLHRSRSGELWGGHDGTC